jgi:signal transduction histidine kinase
LLIDSSRANERLRISRELHDSLGHHLVSLGMNLEIAGRKCNEEARPAIEKARLVARLLLAEVREAVAEYREERMVNLDHALRLLVSNVEDPPVEYEVNLPGQISSQKAHILFRTCEEAITNIRKHARASAARLQIRQDLGRIHLLIHDNGRGVEAVEAGHGLTGIKERFSEAGGSIGWQSKPGGGFLLAGWLPAEDSIA